MKILNPRSPLTHLGLGFILAATLSSQSQASKQDSDFVVQAEYRQMPEPFTTESVLKLDPYQSYPHRQRWVVSRHVEMNDLKAVKKPNGQFGVKAGGLLSASLGYIKGPGPWYQPLQNFSCEAKPTRLNETFATEEGTKLSSSIAANYWSEVLDREKINLILLLKRISEKTEAAALDQGDRTFRKWLRSLYPLWQKEIDQKLRKQEWNSYLTEASAQNICPRKGSSAPPSLSWRSIMEPPPASPPPITKILARAPSRLWDGYYSVRLSIGAAGKILNGRFLIDPGAKESIISPSWLESQGVYPLWVIVPKEIPGRVSWSGPWPGNGSLVTIAKVESVAIGGLKLSMDRFLMKDTEFFSPPDYLKSCCDGILGRDFLKFFPTEFKSESPAEVRVWPIENYRAPNDYQWFEEGEILADKLPTRGNFAYDLPHGRIWLPITAEKVQAPEINKSGLELAYSIINKERILKVKHIRAKSKAFKQLYKSGLKVGTEISEIDSKPAEEIDLTEVNQRLAGHYGDIVSLQWNTGKSLKIFPLKVR